MDLTTVYAGITKHYRDDNGDLVVEGKATGPELDLDQQVCDPVWLKTAMPDWFKVGNIREQHSTIAAGVATDLEQVGDSWSVKSLVVDTNSAKKVEAGVLKGYSIGIKQPRIVKDVMAPNGRIIGGQIVEVSLVDRPCNPTCTLTLTKAAKPGVSKAATVDADRMLVKVEELHEEQPADVKKRDVPQAERDKLADDDKALPGGGFPIKNAKDLRNAINAIGRAKDPAAAKALIKRRAKALGKENLVPAAWKGVDADVTKDDGDTTHDAAAVAAVRAGLIGLIKAELDELEAGEDELCDVSELLYALKMFMCWWADEAAGGEVDAPYTEPGGVTTHVMLDASPDATKTTTGNKPVTDDARLTELVKTAVAEANKTHEATLTALRAELVKVQALPAPGGPVLTRTSVDTAKAAGKDALLVKAAMYRKQAFEITDPATSQGYLEMARDAERAAGKD